MVSTRSTVLALLALLLISSALSAYQLNVTVIDGKDPNANNPSACQPGSCTIGLPGTQVQVLLGNTVLYTAIADNASATAYFNVSAGTYFVKLTRGYYPDHLLMVTVSGDTPLRAILLINRQSYILYGQVIDNPPGRWEGANLSLLDSNGLVQRTTLVGPDGYYIMPYLDTTQTYRLRLNAGARLLSPPFSYSQPNTFYMPLDVRNSTALVNASPSLSVPASAPLYYPITATVKAGPMALPNETVSVLTPGGLLVLTTGADGTVHVNAAQAGDYVFTYRNQTMTTTVAALAMPTPS
ncbi:MAG: hypothetical protein KGH63_02920, partial [Candidatus Micrarchaeota archaeon]|nr:hypothetical protein [Candidatus Micrarchaeota archaeon]